MTNFRGLREVPPVSRMPTGIVGLDAILDGGIPAGRTCLIAGPPGTGKTTLGNQLAFNHAAAGGSVVFATLLTESHDVMLQNLRGFRFYDSRLPGDRIRYINLLSALHDGGLELVTSTIRREIREAGANLLVVDGIAIIDDVATSPFDVRHFAQQLDAQAALLGCTTVILTDPSAEDLRRLGAQLNGMVLLRNERVHSHHVRTLEVTKLRGGRHAGGVHHFAITESGAEVYPRLESYAGKGRPAQDVDDRLGTGVSEIDQMLGGGIPPLSSTMVLGTPGVGKTLFGLSYVAEGTRLGERGLIASFHETAAELAGAAEGIGLDIARHFETGLVQVLWDPPLELSADAWAWRLLEAVRRHRPRRVFIDAITQMQHLITSPERIPAFMQALTNELRALGTTVLFTSEIEAYADDRLAVPVSPPSAAMDNGVLLRHMELNSELRRLISVLKARQSTTDLTIRELLIGDRGIEVTGPFISASGLLTGRGTQGGSSPVT